MKAEKHGRSFLFKNESYKEEYKPSEPVKESSKSEMIRGLHRSGTRTIKELAITFEVSEKEVERIISIV